MTSASDKQEGQLYRPQKKNMLNNTFWVLFFRIENDNLNPLISELSILYFHRPKVVSDYRDLSE